MKPPVRCLRSSHLGETIVTLHRGLRTKSSRSTSQLEGSMRFVVETSAHCAIHDAQSKWLHCVRTGVKRSNWQIYTKVRRRADSAFHHQAYIQGTSRHPRCSHLQRLFQPCCVSRRAGLHRCYGHEDGEKRAASATTADEQYISHIIPSLAPAPKRAAVVEQDGSRDQAEAARAILRKSGESSRDGAFWR